MKTTEKQVRNEIKALKNVFSAVRLLSMGEVDGKPCVLEMIKPFDEKIALDYGDDDRKVEPLKEYFEKTFHDVLTGTYSRRYYEEFWADKVLDGGIAMIDLDDFKIYNDLFGHSVGDDVLKAVAEMLKKGGRSTDKVIRFGGDEFLLIIPGAREAGLKRLLKDIRESVREIAFENYPAIKPTVSVGGVICSGETVKSALRKADELMYEAKRQKDSVVTAKQCGGARKRSSHKERVLVVDDSDINREILSGILQNEYDIIEAKNGKEALLLIEKYRDELAVILLDLIMPVMSGFDVLEYMNERGYIANIPVITISGDDSGKTVRAAYDKGVSDYITRPFDARVVYRRVSNTVKIYARQKKYIAEIAGQIREKEKNRSMIIEILSHVIERPCDGLVSNHASHITDFTRLVLERLVCKSNAYGLNEGDIGVISAAAALHDIGKAFIPSEIVNKKGRFTPEEFEIMKRHTVLGDEILKEVKNFSEEPLIKYAREICLYHHERYDGKGYPKGLKGDEIPIAAQVVSVCDVYDALCSERSYKPAYSHETAIKMIEDGECGAFNPIILECFNECADKFKKITGDEKKEENADE